MGRNRWLWLGMGLILLLLLFGTLAVTRQQGAQVAQSDQAAPAQLMLEQAAGDAVENEAEAEAETELENEMENEAENEAAREQALQIERSQLMGEGSIGRLNLQPGLSPIATPAAVTLFDPRNQQPSGASNYQIQFWEDGEIQSGEQFRSSGGLWAGGELIALVAPGQWLEITCETPSSRVGVHFVGDENDGWARVLVDEELAWEGNTYGPVGVGFNRYLAIRNLSFQRHTIRVEATGEAGAPGDDIPGGNDVTIRAVSCGPTPLSQPIFLPVIAGEGE